MIELQLPNQAKAPPPRVGRRFTDHSKASPESRIHLAPDHPAILRNGTLFPSSVVSAADAPRVLVSGKNSRKLGEIVQKGPWAGFAIYQLTLEERATCPSDCFNRLTCYGNSMPFARRHRVDEALLPAIERDLGIAQRLHPRGFVVRLHVLGDFYSVEYVGAWANFLDQFPALHVFGYTGWSRTHRIGAAILALTEKSWARFAVRFSAASPEPQGATTIWHRPKAAVIAEGIVCPAQTEASACCATCGLCWSAAAKDKTIVFIGHGGINNGGRRRRRMVLTRPAAHRRAEDRSTVQRPHLTAPAISVRTRRSPVPEIVTHIDREIASLTEELKTDPRFRKLNVLRELRAEYGDVAEEEADDTPPARAGRGRRKKPHRQPRQQAARRKTGPNGRGGVRESVDLDERGNLIVAAIKKLQARGIKPNGDALAEEIGITKSQVYFALKPLIADGKIVPVGGYRNRSYRFGGEQQQESATEQESEDSEPEDHEADGPSGYNGRAPIALPAGYDLDQYRRTEREVLLGLLAAGEKATADRIAGYSDIRSLTDLGFAVAKVVHAEDRG